MRYILPETLPSRGEFFKKILEAIFPDRDESFKDTGYGWTNACMQATKELGLDSENDEIIIREDHHVFRFMYELAIQNKKIFNADTALLADRNYERYTSNLSRFCDQYNGSIRNWIDNPDGGVNTYFESSLFFTYLLLERVASRDNRIVFFKYCLELAGVYDIEDSVAHKLYDFSWDDNGCKEQIDGREFVRLGNRASILLGVVVMVIFKNIGRSNVNVRRHSFESLYSLINELFATEIEVQNVVNGAQKTLYNSIKFFDPRSISAPKKFLPDYYVHPRFSRGLEESPTKAICKALKSRRCMISAKTGLGKSMYLNMVALCVLNDQFTENFEAKKIIKDIAQQMSVPDDIFVISIPARMFSFCYRDIDRYREWTNDFVKMYFNCMWKLTGSNNFYSTESSQRSVERVKSNPFSNTEMSDGIYDYIRYLAARGKLLLILDSFDEISAGEMRNAYLKAVAAFYDNYCCYLEEGEIGAHVIISSREMSKKTMGLLENALELNHDSDIYGIYNLNSNQRETLVNKWITDANDAKDILDSIENNHYYRDYSVNPYMLSVVCFCAGFGLSKITQRFIETLVNRMMRNNWRTEDVLQNVLINIEKILQDIAGETVINGNPHFSRQKLARYFVKYIDKNDRTNNDIEQYVERLHEIFVTEVGLIVPADGDDTDYQFINDQIRYELAAKGIQRALENDERTLVYREVILPVIKNVEEYVGLIIPLICEINLQNVQLAELLVTDLSLYEFKNEDEDRLLKQAMVDLILNRYGDSVISVLKTDDIHVRRAQRMVLMRLLSSPTLSLTEEEKREISVSNAMRGNVEWISRKMID